MRLPHEATLGPLKQWLSLYNAMLVKEQQCDTGKSGDLPFKDIPLLGGEAWKSLCEEHISQLSWRKAGKGNMLMMTA